MIRIAIAAMLALIAVPAAAAFASDRITVTVTGKGSDVVLVPGLNSSRRDWEGLVKAVPGHRYHLVQVSGFAGQPVGGNASGNVAAPVAEEIARYIGESHIHPALIGHSMGGTIGLMVAARHPAAITKLMVVDMPPFLGMFFGGPTATPESLKPIADGMMVGMRNTDPTLRLAGATKAIDSMTNTLPMRPAAIADSMASDPDTGARSMRELVLTDLRSELTRISVPTLVLYVIPAGVPATPEQMDGYYKALYTNLNGVTLKRVDNSAHFIMWDQPVRFADEVRGFLG